MATVKNQNLFNYALEGIQIFKNYTEDADNYQNGWYGVETNVSKNFTKLMKLKNQMILNFNDDMPVFATVEQTNFELGRRELYVGYSSYFYAKWSQNDNCFNLFVKLHCQNEITSARAIIHLQLNSENLKFENEVRLQLPDVLKTESISVG